MTDPERDRIVRDLSGQGVVYAIALIAVLAIFFLTAIGPILTSGPHAPPQTSERRPPLFPGSPGQ